MKLDAYLQRIVGSTEWGRDDGLLPVYRPLEIFAAPLDGVDIGPVDMPTTVLVGAPVVIGGPSTATTKTTGEVRSDEPKRSPGSLSKTSDDVGYRSRRL